MTSNHSSQALRARIEKPIVSAETGGLIEIASAVEGRGYAGCDPAVQGAQQCAAMNEAAAHQQIAAQSCLLGLALFATVIAGSLAVGFIHLTTMLAAPIGKHRVYALFPRKGGLRP